MATNLPTFYVGTTRAGEVAGADWTGGVNRGGSCAPGVGINTGNYDPKASDWPRIEDAATGRKSQAIGETAAAITVDQGVDVNDVPAFTQATGATAPDGVLNVTNGAVNKTGQTVPANSWCWGVVPVA